MMHNMQLKRSNQKQHYFLVQFEIWVIFFKHTLLPQMCGIWASLALVDKIGLHLHIVTIIIYTLHMAMCQHHMWHWTNGKLKVHINCVVVYSIGIEHYSK
jgi:hypothetical protein